MFPAMTAQDVHHVAVEEGSAPLDSDARQLAETGHEQELHRQFDIWSMLALAFCVLGTWSTLAQNLASGLTYGGPVSILWGLVFVTFCNLCIAVSMGELTSSMPTALGQAYWIYRLWTTPSGRFVSYMCAWINTFGWWTLTASQLAFMAEFMLGMKVMFQENWSGANKGWLQFVIYVGLTITLTIVNIVACRKDRVLPWINNVVGVQFVLLFFVFALAMLISVGVRSNLQYEPASFVFATWSNETTWPNGVVWFIGLVQSAYGLTAFDSCVHMIEELPRPTINGPRVIWLSVLMGAVSGFLFMMVCLFTMQDLDAISNADLPFMEIVLETVGLQGAAVLLAFFIINGVGQAISIMTTGSRLTWGFARDGGLPWHSHLARVSHTWNTPVWALVAQGIIIALTGLLYLFANTVLTAILSVSTIALTFSYAMPIVTLLFVGRDKLPSRDFRLGRLSGYLVNIISVIYCVITVIFFFFPSDPNPAPADMNWAIAVFGVMLVVSLGFWVVQGRKSYLQTEDALFRVISASPHQDLETVPDLRDASKTKRT